MRVTDQITGEHQAFTLTRQGVGLIFPLVPPRSGGTLIFGVTYRKSTTMANESLNTSPLLPTFARAELSFERGEGPWLITEKGERYLDFGAGIAVNALGHAHPHLVKALTDQAQRVWHVSNLYNIPDGERLAQRLVDNTFADHVFFTNSGAEALECAIKMARKYHFGQRPARALSHHYLRRRVPRPHAGDHRRRRAEEISRRLRSQGRWLRPGPVRRPSGA